MLWLLVVLLVVVARPRCLLPLFVVVARCLYSPSGSLLMLVLVACHRCLLLLYLVVDAYCLARCCCLSPLLVVNTRCCSSSSLLVVWLVVVTRQRCLSELPVGGAVVSVVVAAVCDWFMVEYLIKIVDLVLC